jgi:hypothetical protein
MSASSWREIVAVNLSKCDVCRRSIRRGAFALWRAKAVYDEFRP